MTKKTNTNETLLMNYDNEEIQKEYEQMLKDFEEDKKKHDFTIFPQWDKDFREIFDHSYKRHKQNFRLRLLIILLSFLSILGICSSIFFSQIIRIEITSSVFYRHSEFLIAVFQISFLTLYALFLKVRNL